MISFTVLLSDEDADFLQSRVTELCNLEKKNISVGDYLQQITNNLVRECRARRNKDEGKVIATAYAKLNQNQKNAIKLSLGIK